MKLRLPYSFSVLHVALICKEHPIIKLQIYALPIRSAYIIIYMHLNIDGDKIDFSSKIADWPG